jgi:luciferase-type oxidoreductase
VNDVLSHPGFRQMFGHGDLTLGIFFAIESYSGAVPSMERQVELARRAEDLGFAALWFRDVPLLDPTFGDAGQVYDPWVYVAHIGAHTSAIALATGGIVLPLRYPLDVAKSAASVDALTGGRMVLGLSSGDRPVEYPAYGLAHGERAARFAAAIEFLTQVHGPFPTITSPLGTMTGQADLLPKPVIGRMPLLAVGRAGQSLTWLARHMDGYVTYPRPPAQQSQTAREWRHAVTEACAGFTKPLAQSLYLDLVEDDDAPAVPIHLGFRLGRHALLEVLRALHRAGVAHVVLNLKNGTRPADEVLDEIGEHVLPEVGDRVRVPGGLGSA